MKKVLIISLAFPPVPYVGVLRITKFCKYLPEMGWQPSVLTQKVREFYEGKDWSPMEDINKDISIIRTPNFQPFYWWDHPSHKGRSSLNFSSSKALPDVISSRLPLNIMTSNILRPLRKLLTVPDEKLVWIPQAFLPGIKQIHREKIDVIFSSSPVVTNHILGYLLSLLTGRPHVVDFRDLWTLNEVYFARQLPGFLKQYDKLWEKAILNHSKRIIVVNQTLKKQLTNTYPGICRNKVEVIYNGFDDEDKEQIDLPTLKNDQFTIVYAGSIYVHRSPVFFFEALSEWVHKNEAVRKKIKVDFYGSGYSNYSQKILDLKLGKIATFHPRVTRKEILQVLFNADLLLLIHGFNKLVASSTSTKLFEYLATGKPILALMPESEAADIVRKYSKKNTVVSIPDTKKVVGFMQKQFDEWDKMKRPIPCEIDTSPEFSRKNQAKKLGFVLDTLLNKDCLR